MEKFSDNKAIASLMVRTMEQSSNPVNFHHNITILFKNYDSIIAFDEETQSKVKCFHIVGEKSTKYDLN